jgi:hypothetical protein
LVLLFCFSICIIVSLFALLFLIVVDIISFFTVALAATLARVAALEAKLKTSTEALKDANAAKVPTQKAAKAASTMAKKAKKALAEANQKQTITSQNFERI